jgi:hypothetical protein
MRIIKFNVYDTYLKQYVCKGISLLGEAMMFGRIEQYCDENPNPAYKHSLQRLKDIVFLQFTGLLDKNGVEIYEGSITKSGKQILFDDGMFIFGRQERIEDVGTNWWSKEEVIGDIYTNPKLL